ncbi:UvrD-helicase domain-containing protein [Massilia sp. Mn16-1_5]|uniref:UvrD-helicase domain-containing protein n=1 Tax=Massilia sp. Mn16-1_5 TaxID=2079199 RepID=UPI00109E8C45|nr:UvrD-helicase domain-containing protein [Massilia sp. Mn16-1_5]THC43654.1 ATP-binding protein [Massilia sp. Mn16-1_5]
MALFIPEWTRASGRQLQVKRVLNGLDEATVVRKPLREEAAAPELFIEHEQRGWLALAVVDTPFDGLDARQLFAVETRTAFDAQVQAWRAALPETLPLLLVLWACSEDEVSVLAGQVDAKNLRLLSRERYLERGAAGLAALQRPLEPAEEDALRTRFFPESGLPLLPVARRRFQRNNQAVLGGLFLDSQQEWASKLDLDLPDEQVHTATDLAVRLVNGVAGSGKTLIALSRALLLAEMHPRERVLILIHNTPIVADIRERLHRARGSLPDNLEITTYSAWIHRQWRRLFGPSLAMPADPQYVPNLVRALRTSWPDLKLQESQLIEEFDFLNEMLVASEAEYMDTSRAGRGFSLRAKERREVWRLFEAVTEALQAAGLRLWSAVTFEVCRAPGHGALERYEHILIDEAQFFAPSWFHTVKLALKPQGRLFLCADPNQGFMKSRLSWRNAGLDVAGRTKKLLRSYRTTQAILHSAGTLLARAVQADPEDYLEPDFTGMEEGAAPILIRVDKPQDAVDRAVNEIVELVQTRGLPLSAFLVIYGSDTPKQLLYRRLCAALGVKRVWWLNKDKKQPPDGYGPDYLRLANLETATGLEGGAVFLLGVEGLLNVEEGDAREADARKLYMAMTRASHRLVMLSTEALPPDALPLFRAG